MDNNSPNAALIIIGNEILSGRTQDTNLNFIAKELKNIGIKFLEVRVIPDIEEKIITTVNELRKTYHYVFTTGGIGPTHDDITAASVAKAFGLEIIKNAEAEKILRDYYTANNKVLNPISLKMAQIPKGANLINNPVSGAPGFVIDNVFVMAGVPKIMQSMFLNILPKLKHGIQIYTKEFDVPYPESKLAALMEQLQEKYNDKIDIGSYPYNKESIYGTNVVFNSIDKEIFDKACVEFLSNLKILGLGILN